MSDQIDQLAAALSAAQAEIEDAERSRQNPAFRSQYSTLGDIWDACRPALVKHGLAVAQGAEPSDPGTISLTTTLLHKSGQFISHTQNFRLVKDDPQGFGSASTYARRYGLAAMVGVCPDDDDGNAASGRNGPPPASAGAARPAPPRSPSPAAHSAHVEQQVAEKVAEKVAAADPRKPLWDEMKALADKRGVKPQAFIDAVFSNDGKFGVRAADLTVLETKKVVEYARDHAPAEQAVPA